METHLNFTIFFFPYDLFNVWKEIKEEINFN